MEFTSTIHGRRPAKCKASKTYGNPVALALEWQHALNIGRYSSQADLAKKKRISRARVTQTLNLLRLPPKIIGIIMGLGDPLPSRTITERQLRQLINLPSRKQLKELMIILAGMQSSREPTHRS